MVAPPVPATTHTKRDGEPFPAKVSLELAAPLILGANLTLIVRLWPAGMVLGSVKPVTLNSELVVVIELIDAAKPVTPNLTATVLVEPTGTLPKFRLVGVTDTFPAAAPLPDNGMVKVRLLAYVTARLPYAAVATVGAKVTLKVIECPAARVVGNRRPLTLNPLPLIAERESASEVFPELRRTAVWLLLLPTNTAPKLMLVGVGTRV